MLSLWLRGAVAVPINPAFPQKQRDLLLEQTNCQECLDDAFWHSIGIDKLLQTSEAGWEKDFSWPDWDAEAWAAIIFTSGSTGSSKAVVLSLGNFFYSALGANEAMPLLLGHAWLLSLPLFHVGGLGIPLRTLLSGANLIIPQPKERLSRSLEKYDVTHISLVPTQLYRLLQNPSDVASLRHLELILLGGAGIAQNLQEAIQENELPVYATYGCTEMASQVASFPLTSKQNLADKSPAPILPYRECQIDASNEIHLRGRTRFEGYWVKGQLQKPFDQDGWFATGDLGHWQENRLQVYGRKDAMFISGGENIHPETIENALLNNPDIEQAVVVPVKDTEFGARPVAFIKSPVHEPYRWHDQLHQTLAGFQIPDLFLPWRKEDFSTLKPKRQALSKAAQSDFNEWAKWRFLRNWLKKFPPGWKHPLSLGQKQVFKIIDHQDARQPSSIFVLALSRAQGMTWLLKGPGKPLLTLDALQHHWVQDHQPRVVKNEMRERLEIVRLVTEDPHPQDLIAFDATCKDQLKERSISFPPAQPRPSPYLSIQASELPAAHAICLGSQEAIPVNESSAPILQIGIYLPKTKRSYLIRCLYKDAHFPEAFFGWKVQTLREADGVEVDQPFWEVAEREAFLLQELMQAYALIPQIIPADANLPQRESRRRNKWQQDLPS